MVIEELVAELSQAGIPRHGGLKKHHQRIGEVVEAWLDRGQTPYISLSAVRDALRQRYNRGSLDIADEAASPKNDRLAQIDRAHLSALIHEAVGQDAVVCYGARNPRKVLLFTDRARAVEALKQEIVPFTDRHAVSRTYGVRRQSNNHTHLLPSDTRF